MKTYKTYEKVIAEALAGKVPLIPIDEAFLDFLEEQGFGMEVDITEFAGVWEEWLKAECE
jgi:hypothetical protein